MPSPIQAVRDICRRHGCTNQTVLLAVSGGIDSMTLLTVMATLAGELGLTIVVGHVDHGLRTDATADSALVQHRCTLLGIPCVTLSVDVPSHAETTGLGIEGAARDLRYGALDVAASAVGAAVILTAHTMDDAAETLLLQLARGTGLAGQAGMAVSRPTNEGHTLLRPLLACRRSDVTAYARANGVVWREDPTNTDLRFLRNRVRHVVMPVLRETFGDNIAERLARSARLSQDDRTIVDLAIDRLVDAADTDDGILVSLLTDHPESVRRAVLRRCVTRRTGLTLALPATERLSALLMAETGRSVPLGQGWTALRERRTIVLLPRTSGNCPQAHVVSLAPATYVAGSFILTVSIHTCPSVTLATPSAAWLDAAAVEGPLVWRPWAAGDRLHPVGMHGSKLVSDILHDAHVPLRIRSSMMVLADDVGILWVCGLRRDRRAHPTAATTTALFLQLSTTIPTNAPLES